MRIVGKNIKSVGNITMLLFLTGLFLGFLVMTMGKSTLLINSGLFDEDTLYHMKYMTVDSSALFCYILRKRLGELLLMSVAVTTYLGLFVCHVAVVWYGVSTGVFLSALMLRYGLKGLILAVIGIFPQYLLYIPALLLFLKWAEHLYRSIYSRNMASDAGEKGFVLRKTGQLAMIAGFLLAGCLLEGYVNPKLLLGYLKIF